MNTRTFKEFVLGESAVAKTVNISTNIASFTHKDQIGWIGGWKGISKSAEVPVVKPFPTDAKDYETSAGEILVRLGNTRTSIDGSASIVKLNLSKGLIFFGKDYSGDTEFEWDKPMKFGFFTTGPLIWKDYFKQ